MDGANCGGYSATLCIDPVYGAYLAVACPRLCGTCSTAVPVAPVPQPTATRAPDVTVSRTAATAATTRTAVKAVSTAAHSPSPTPAASPTTITDPWKPLSQRTSEALVGTLRNAFPALMPGEAKQQMQVVLDATGDTPELVLAGTGMTHILT